MTNREYLAKMTNEELVKSFYFCQCPIEEIYRKAQAAKGNIICQRDEFIKTCDEYKLDAHKQVKEICTKCKIKWLESEHID